MYIQSVLNKVKAVTAIVLQPLIYQLVVAERWNLYTIPSVVNYSSYVTAQRMFRNHFNIPCNELVPLL